MSKPRLIAFYLPQFYPTKENDEWWEPGFTEWTNVAKAKPLFKGHYQPRIPRDLGFYDLRVPETRELQAQLAREAGIEGFCYWHYWFAGRRLLDRVFTEVVESGQPDFPFCLCWANHSWYQKTWDSTKPDKLLIEQTYPGEHDFIEHFYAMLPAFKDKRYLKVNGKNLFGIFDPMGLGEQQFKTFSIIWNKLARENGLPDFYFFAFTTKTKVITTLKEFKYDHIVVDYIGSLFQKTNILKKSFKRAIRPILNMPDKIYEYNDYCDIVLELFANQNEVWPCILPNFDHSPRSNVRGFILTNDSPEKWEKLCSKVFELCQNKCADENLVFVKAWNEWGEGNYLEPDLRFGKKYIESTHAALSDY